MILILGPTGAGKSVQAKALVSRHPNFVWFALGAILRSTQDPKLSHLLLEGKLIDDELADKLLRDKMKSLLPGHTAVLDGFPRRVTQVGDLEQIAKDCQRKVLLVVNLIISRQTAEGRLKMRQRADDTPEAIEQKWQWYQNDTVPVIEHFRKAGLVVDVDGELPVSQVSIEVEKAVTSHAA